MLTGGSIPINTLQLKFLMTIHFLPSLTLLLLMLLLNISLYLVCFLSLCASVYAEQLFPEAKFWAFSPHSIFPKKKQKHYYNNSHENPNK